MDDKEQILKDIYSDRNLAHRILFRHRHPDESPPFHSEMISDMYSETPNLVQEAFRGAAKSTIAEECGVVGALCGEFRNGLIIGSSWERAIERLRAIKWEIANNENILELFGDMVGETWSEGRIVLKNGTALQGYGRGQSLRGVKHLGFRPDWCLIDDFEDEESVATPEAREKVMSWLVKVLIPALDIKKRKIRIIGTPLDPEAAIVKLSRTEGWVFRKYPVEHIEPDGSRRATWPSRIPLAKIDELKKEYEGLGRLREYNQEFMCEAEEEKSKPFKPSMFREEPVLRTWHSVYAFCDPARTVGAKSAHTGFAIWSWINNRLIIWDAYGRFFMPDEIIEEMFRINELYQPVNIGIERDGLEQFLLQPIRQEMVKRGIVLPYEAMKAPKGKIDFIKGLQPFFNAGEAIFAKDMPDLRNQLLSFPTGRIDVPNALAYSLKMRPGRVIYEDFTVLNITDEIRPFGTYPIWLIISGTQSSVCGVVCQYLDNSLHVLWDIFMEGEGRMAEVISAATQMYGTKLNLLLPIMHYETYDTIGLKPQMVKTGKTIYKGGELLTGKNNIRNLLKMNNRGLPSLQVSALARWTLNGFSGGYCMGVSREGILQEIAKEGPYKTIMESIESFMGKIMILNQVDVSDEAKYNYSYTKDGKRYISALPR